MRLHRAFRVVPVLLLLVQAACTSTMPSAPTVSDDDKLLGLPVVVPSDPEGDRFYKSMHGQYAKMQEQLGRAEQAKDSLERQRALDEHLEFLLKATDTLMGRGDGTPGMAARPSGMGPEARMAPVLGLPTEQPSGMGPGARMAPPDMTSPSMMAWRMRRLEQRIETIQMMLDQMVGHERSGSVAARK